MSSKQSGQETDVSTNKQTNQQTITRRETLKSGSAAASLSIFDSEWWPFNDENELTELFDISDQTATAVSDLEELDLGDVDVTLGEVSGLTSQTVTDLEGSNLSVNSNGVLNANVGDSTKDEEYDYEYVVHVDDFGAVGDGSTDDSGAFQDAVNSVGSEDRAALKLSPGKYYYLGSRVSIDPERIRIIDGNNGYLVLKSDIIGLDINGGKTGSGSNPDSGNNSSLSEREFGTRIENVQAYSPSYSGTPIRVRNTVATQITGCTLQKLKKGIELTETNRNVTITDNHIWDIAEFGVHFNGGDLHQCIINDNYMQWARNVIRIENGDFADFIIADNSLETGNNEENGSDVVLNIISSSSSYNLWNVLVEGNVFDGHNGTNRGIRLAAASVSSENVTGVRIVNNYISQFPTAGIDISEMNQVTISNNTLERNGTDISASGANKAILISDNIFQQLRSSSNTSGITYTTDDLVSNFKVTDNEFVDWTGQAIAINDESSSANNRSEISITDNIVHISSNASGISGYIIDLDTSANFNNVRLSENTIRGRDVGEGGIRASAEGYKGAIIKENMVRGISTGTPLNLPSGDGSTHIVVDNIAV